MDYFGARYFSSAQGRFTSIDPIQYSKGRLLDPQQWNMYGYARGNPLRWSDPTGTYNTTCNSKDITECSQDIQNFEAQRQKDLHSKSARVRRGAAAYGSFNDGNKVSLVFDPTAVHAGGAKQNFVAGHVKDSFTVTFQNGNHASFNRELVHEGSHVADMLSAMNGGQNVTHFQSELEGFKTSADVMLDGDSPASPLFGFQVQNYQDEATGKTLTLYDPAIPLNDKINESSIKEFLIANPTYSQTNKKPIYVKPKGQ